MMKKIMLSALLLSLPFMSYAQQAFTSPEDAASAFATAVAQQNEAQLTALLGDNWRHFLPPEGADPEAIARFNRDWKISHHIIQQDNMAHLNVGQENWQLPIPMVKTSKGWQFDMAEAQEEILTRTIGRNELSAIEALHAYVDAQQSYYALNQSYAQKIVSSEGKKDGLYWPVSPGETPSPLGPAFSPQEPGAGYHGYRFRIIPDKASGFAMVAWPVDYGQTGIMSFMISGDDTVYQANLGEASQQKAQALSEYSPDKTWQAVTP
ncbi:DUF2950 family protein [Citrobacter sp. EC_71]|uniref:DUF2950 family protein n=1 Tax=unclassified Citrobacter TaxID=2644389 RepID=UPI0010C9AFD8|nr:MULTISPECIES: DUF2950 family protein [unclassified Citrobacter]MBW9351438.1 DUF2950 family protein [Citrobacter sp. EC_71]TKU03429.1 DUF2950 domain-containing protein [Citrobacter sp. wls830]TKV16460.1 DUF2950 domain-containing protein [Citrobacter sp. wls615]